MPPQAIKTVVDLIYWQYAKIIADSAGFGKRHWRFVMSRFKKFQQGEIFWNEIREYVKEREKRDECIFCGSKSSLTLEHMFPKALGGPDDEKNVVWVCRACNSSKRDRRLYGYYALRGRAEDRKVRRAENRRGKIPEVPLRNV
jgi:hypothetical protein